MALIKSSTGKSIEACRPAYAAEHAGPGRLAALMLMSPSAVQCVLSRSVDRASAPASPRGKRARGAALETRPVLPHFASAAL